MSVLVKVQTANKNSLILPTDAIIRGTNSSMVWLQTGKNKFNKQMVTTGLESNGVTEITSGLSSGDAVVISGAYLLHSEYVFKRGSAAMNH